MTQRSFFWSEYTCFFSKGVCPPSLLCCINRVSHCMDSIGCSLPSPVSKLTVASCYSLDTPGHAHLSSSALADPLSGTLSPEATQLALFLPHSVICFNVAYLKINLIHLPQQALTPFPLFVFSVSLSDISFPKVFAHCLPFLSRI